MKIYYLAYGSNLHPVRLRERVPSARQIGVVELTRRKVVFTKVSKDGSAKANLVEASEHEHPAWGCVYELDHHDKSSLDRAEGLGYGYIEQQTKCPIDDLEYLCFTYVASSDALQFDMLPYTWYRDLIVAGAECHGFSSQYVESLRMVDAKRDTDSSRQDKNDDLLRRLSEY